MRSYRCADINIVKSNDNVIDNKDGNDDINIINTRSLLP